MAADEPSGHPSAEKDRWTAEGPTSGSPSAGRAASHLARVILRGLIPTVPGHASSAGGRSNWRSPRSRGGRADPGPAMATRTATGICTRARRWIASTSGLPDAADSDRSGPASGRTARPPSVPIRAGPEGPSSSGRSDRRPGSRIHRRAAGTSLHPAGRHPSVMRPRLRPRDSEAQQVEILLDHGDRPGRQVVHRLLLVARPRPAVLVVSPHGALHHVPRPIPRLHDARATRPILPRRDHASRLPPLEPDANPWPHPPGIIPGDLAAHAGGSRRSVVAGLPSEPTTAATRTEAQPRALRRAPTYLTAERLVGAPGFEQTRFQSSSR